MEGDIQYTFTETYSDAVFSNAQANMREKVNNYMKYGEAKSNATLQDLMLKAQGTGRVFAPVHVESISVSTIFAEGLYRITVALLCCTKSEQYENHGQTAMATQLLVS